MASALRNIGLMMLFLGAIAIGIGLGDVITTILECDSALECPKPPLPSFTDLFTNGPEKADKFATLFTWVAAGIWGGAVTFITGLVLMQYAAGTRSQTVATVASFITGILVVPLMIFASGVKIFFVISGKPGKMPLVNLETFSTSQPIVKFILPAAVCAVGAIIWFLDAFALINLCAKEEPKPEDEEELMSDEESEKSDDTGSTRSRRTGRSKRSGSTRSGSTARS